MAVYRLYFRDDFMICGRDDFDAVDDAEALAVAEIVADACSDICTRFEVWQGRRVVGGSRNRLGSAKISLKKLREQRQQLAIEREIAIKDSVFAVASSRRLLETLDQMKIDPMRLEVPPKA